MTDHLDDILVAESRRQGLQPSADAMKAAAIALAGSRVEGDFIVSPTGQSIHVRDAVASLHASQPESFTRIDATTDDDHGYSPGTLTARMIEENRRNRMSGKPVDAGRYRGLTAQFLAENAARKAGR